MHILFKSYKIILTDHSSYSLGIFFILLGTVNWKTLYLFIYTRIMTKPPPCFVGTSSPCSSCLPTTGSGSGSSVTPAPAVRAKPRGSSSSTNLEKVIIMYTRYLCLQVRIIVLEFDSRADYIQKEPEE